MQDIVSVEHGLDVWDVVRVEFPYADQALSRRRPALVVAIPRVIERFDILWLLMITSGRHDAWPGDVLVSDLMGAGLTRPSFVRTTKVSTVDARLAERIGRLAAQDRQEVSRQLRGVLSNVLA